MASDSHLPVVAIVGRPNVGKSALFNQIVGRRLSIVHEQSGVTRDRVASPAHYAGRHFLLVDTGGLGLGPKQKKGADVFDGLIRDQVAAIVAEADALIWVVDCQEGMTRQDEEIRDFMMQSELPVVIAANKADNEPLREGAFGAFAGLGIKELTPTSCTHNYGTGELMRRVLHHVPAVAEPLTRDGGIRIAVIGRPNVGKSSLINRVFGEERVIVSDVAGTTRDAIDVPVMLTGKDEEIPATFIDTAGLRKKRSVDTVVEFFSTTRTESAIRRADMILFVIDATDPGTAQDRRIARMIKDQYKPCILLVNKWDLVSGEKKQQDLAKDIRHAIPFMQHAPMHFICAVSGYNFAGIFDHILMLRDQMQVTIPTSVLNQFVQDTLARTPPTSVGTKRFKVFYGTMKGNPPPHIVLFANSKSACAPNYLQFLENRLRDAFFPEAGLPIKLEIRERRSEEDPNDGRRHAVRGVKRRKEAERNANARHNQRRKGYRKK
jgi:GTP-binding protein